MKYMPRTVFSYEHDGVTLEIELRGQRTRASLHHGNNYVVRNVAVNVQPDRWLMLSSPDDAIIADAATAVAQALWSREWRAAKMREALKAMGGGFPNVPALHIDHERMAAQVMRAATWNSQSALLFQGHERILREMSHEIASQVLGLVAQKVEDAT